MKKYKVTIPYPCFVSVDVEAEDEESAEDLAWDDASITSYAGNGGLDKLIGVYGSNVSIVAGDEPLEDSEFHVEVEEIE